MKTETKKKIADAVDSMAKQINAINHKIFDRPELCYEEFFAAELVVDFLKSKGFEVEAPYAGLQTAFKAVHKGRGKGPNIAILTEYDALPEIGHACGHSMIAASSCGAAAAIISAAADHPGTLTVVGTPAEERGGGKVKMIEKGAFEGIDAAMMVHPSNKTRVIARMYAIKEVDFTFLGKAAHAACFPDQGVNALDAAVLFYNAVSAMRQQLKSEARVHGIFTHGGDAPNIIPEKISMAYYIRALDSEYFREVVDKINECAKGAAKASGCKVVIKNSGHYYEPFSPSYPIGEAFKKNMESVGIVDEGFAETDEIGSSDIGNVSQIMPTLHPEYAIGKRDQINHSRDFLEAVSSKKGAEAMIGMTKALAMTVYDLLSDPELMTRVKKDFDNRKKKK